MFGHLHAMDWTSRGRQGGSIDVILVELEYTSVDTLMQGASSLIWMMFW